MEGKTRYLRDCSNELLRNVLWISEAWSFVLFVIPVLLSIFIEQYYGKAAFVYRFDSMIESELERQQRIYRLYALFVDVPMVHKPQAHRRSYLDGVLKVLVGKKSKWSSLFSESYGRSYESIYEFIITTGSCQLCSCIIFSRVLLELYRQCVTCDAIRIPTCGVIQSANTQNSHFASLVDSNTRLKDNLSVLMMTMVASGVVLGISSVIGMREMIGLVGLFSIRFSVYSLHNFICVIDSFKKKKNLSL